MQNPYSNFDWSSTDRPNPFKMPKAPWQEEYRPKSFVRLFFENSPVRRAFLLWCPLIAITSYYMRLEYDSNLEKNLPLFADRFNLTVAEGDLCFFKRRVDPAHLDKIANLK